VPKLCLGYLNSGHNEVMEQMPGIQVYKLKQSLGKWNLGPCFGKGQRANEKCD